MTQFDKQLFWELLIACQRTKSLARASAQLRLSLSSASKLIAAFETQTQLQLLDRTTRPATLTRNFERLVPIAQKLVKTNVEAQRIIQTLKSEAKGETVHGRIIRICLPINVRNDAILERLLDYASASPGLRLEFFGDEGYERLLAGDVDIAQFGFFPNNQTLRADFIRTNGFLMLASRSFVARYGLPQASALRLRFAIRKTAAFPDVCSMVKKHTFCPTATASSMRTPLPADPYCFSGAPSRSMYPSAQCYWK